MLENYYRLLGWDVETGKPLQSTLKSLNLEYVAKGLW
jgi:aldehyde:ferredoxin oxidoreductase